jgi:HSP20 family protein
MGLDVLERDPLRPKKPWSWISNDDFFALRAPDLRMKDFRAPMIRVSDAERVIRIAAELPGIDSKNLKVSLADRSVSIEGVHASAQKETDPDHRVLYAEFESSRFVRQVPLPDAVDPKKAKISFRNGLLEIVAPKALPGVPKRKNK